MAQIESRRDLENKEEPKIAQAAERAGSLIRELESRLRARDGGTEAAPPQESLPSEAEDLDRQLQEYFQHTELSAAGSQLSPTVIEEIRNRVINGVVDRILREWDQPRQESASSLQNEVLKRLIDRVLERLSG